jgi:hypothetical protein
MEINKNLSAERDAALAGCVFVCVGVHPSATGEFDIMEFRLVDAGIIRSWPWPKDRIPFGIGEKFTSEQIYEAFLKQAPYDRPRKNRIS